MGVDITFKVGAKTVGRLHFSVFTMRRQEMLHGLSWWDCLPLDGPDGEWFRVDWDEAERQFARLWQAVRDTTDEHAIEYDTPRVVKLGNLIRHCSDPSRRHYAWVRISP